MGIHNRFSDPCTFKGPFEPRDNRFHFTKDRRTVFTKKFTFVVIYYKKNLL